MFAEFALPPARFFPSNCDVPLKVPSLHRLSTFSNAWGYHEAHPGRMYLYVLGWWMVLDGFACCNQKLAQQPASERSCNCQCISSKDLMFCCRSCSAFSQLPSTCKGVAKAKSIPPWMKLSQLFAPRRSARSINVRDMHHERGRRHQPFCHSFLDGVMWTEPERRSDLQGSPAVCS